ncbi:L,D-transpeptidase family protein [Varunaivibrio sulfuroxidans]|uniref:L,D-peptidoglycan transpeptidase YkuD (ErfK/YbiS/YcfS/YnhG family) n=1 Tax=Varunaivibrio sulfuroxidans TaxID=1773489 RepID=A0A4R3JHL8_9PROT|nr:L,D-transpeptidase family protein [Varunaivibrio sulfuroxidans]TCS64843.1 L,D-peptidoglycan transpeptidase YkuD (ErfK/YbiS/YcfS/YnhG family) [Varunaivibrio sulfuroxidans]WES29856.1 L,D-transpeptidase family protein [Varunaivibrio sulfuroxidans]
MTLTVYPDGRFEYPQGIVRCALGRGGVRAAKREGDGATPAGNYPLRRVFYRADRLTRPWTGLPVVALDTDDAWCDDPLDPHYNRRVRLPFTPSHERLWRDDSLYDIIIEIGHNDHPTRPFLGSAVFIHLARANYAPTRGCVALAPADMLDVLTLCDETTAITILAPGRPA